MSNLQTQLQSVPQTPTFACVEDERRHRKQRLAAAFRLLAHFGFDDGVAGHISVRDPENLDQFWVNPFGTHFSLIRVSDLLRVNYRGEVLEGNKTVNEAAFNIHAPIHAARPDVTAVVHVHSTYGQCWSTLGRLLDPITQSACRFYEDHSLFDDFSGLVLNSDYGKQIAIALGDKKAIILRNHGLLTVGHSVDEATWWYITMERSCQIQLTAEAAGRPILIDPDTARLTYRQLGSHHMGWFAFQPLYDMIVHQQPDLLD
jgi:ribulose-5-phosphate 4-epimerase/fuculose-1-phosphate aldolase